MLIYKILLSLDCLMGEAHLQGSFLPDECIRIQSALQTCYPQVKCVLSQVTKIVIDFCYASFPLFHSMYWKCPLETGLHFCSPKSRSDISKAMFWLLQCSTSVHQTLQVAVLIKQSSVYHLYLPSHLTAVSPPVSCSMPSLR